MSTSTEKIVKNSKIIFNSNYDKVLKTYYEYVLKLFEEQMSPDFHKNIFFSIPDPTHKNKQQDIHVGIQYEHTLVKQNGRGSEGSKIGKVHVGSTNEKYLVRIQDYEKLKKCDLVVEYSYLNYQNILRSELYEDYLEKTLVISPLIFEKPTLSNLNRKNKIITTFTNLNEPRRKFLYERAREKKINIQNSFGFWEKQEIKNLYQNTKILLNIRQTPHHDTLEELRILPAIMNGCLVVCENCPLKEELIYKNFIIWSDYDEILEKSKEVLDNYDYYWEKIFIKNNFLSVFEEIKTKNKSNISNALEKVKK